jgi:type IV secretion system protein VirB10
MDKKNTDVAAAAPQDDDEEKFDMSPEEATGLDGGKPNVINRKRILIVICIFFAVFVCGGVIFNALKQNKKSSASEEDLYAANSSSDFLNSLQNRALYNRRDAEAEPPTHDEPDAKTENEPLLPPASFSSSRQVDSVRQPPPYQPAPSSSQPPPAQSNEPPPTHFKSPLIPVVEGRLFSQPGQYAQPAATASNSPARSPADEYLAALAANRAYDGRVSDYAAQNDQQNKMSFYGSSDNSAAGAGSGFFIGENSLWTGTIIPGVLETAINTDLPGNIIARVTQNVYDSQTGRNLLLPQGTLLLARYNSSVSYAQHRVQIVWDAMIRPDGFQIDLEGANGVDKAGMSGQAAKYHENWFEYLKAAGLITLFSIANARMTETAAKYASEASSGNIAESNTAYVNQIGGNLIGRAMNIQPTLTVDNGTPVNIMLNRTLYLPPVPPYPASQKYILE